MKKRQTSSKNSKSKSGHSIPKKGVRSKGKDKKSKEQQHHYILLGNQFYLAATKTQRNTCDSYEKRVKTKPSMYAGNPMASTSESNQNINPKQYVSTLSKQQKRALLQQLQQQLEIQKEQPIKQDKSPQTQLEQLQKKLDYIKIQLCQEAQNQTNTINHLFETEQISLEDKNEKIGLVQKLMKNKLKMLECANNLFHKIMNEKISVNKQQQLEQIINSIHSLPSLNQLEQHSARNSHANVQPVPFDVDLPFIANKLSPYKKQPEDEQFQKSLQKAEGKDIESVHMGNSSQTPNIQIFSKENLKLDIRLDQVQFGRDHYDEQDKKQEQSNKKQEIDKNHLQVDVKGGVGPTITPVENQNNFTVEQKKLQEEFLSVQSQGADSSIKIPLLMTKQRKEQLQYEKSSKQVQNLNIAIKNRHSFQVSQVPPQNDDHFTTLLDVNNFVVSFYEFIMKRFMREVIEGLNLAYGKSAVDKIFQIRNQGYVDDFQNHNILPEQLLSQYHKQMILSVRKIPEYQKIHNKAIFTAFNAGLNVYRPYYELEGEVFPWNTSEKGLTFYQINQQNIQEVFEKSKMKVLQYCASLCGMMPNCQVTTEQATKIISKRNQECYQRVIKGEVVQKFSQWYLKILNFEALTRLSLSQQIWEYQLALALSEITDIHK